MAGATNGKRYDRGRQGQRISADAENFRRAWNSSDDPMPVSRAIASEYGRSRDAIRTDAYRAVNAADSDPLGFISANTNTMSIVGKIDKRGFADVRVTYSNLNPLRSRDTDIRTTTVKLRVFDFTRKHKTS